MEETAALKDGPGGAGSSSLRGTILAWGAIVFIIVTLLSIYRFPAVLLWPARILFAACFLYLLFIIVKKLKAGKFDGKKAVFSLILVAFLYGALYIICAVFVKLMSVKDERLAATHTIDLGEKTRRVTSKLMAGNYPFLFDRETGWSHRPNYVWRIHTVNEQGLRGDRVYDVPAPDPDKRILCIGDSFTFGYEVEDDQTFPYYGEQILPDWEWVNLGITGTGLTQSLMQYRKNGRKYGGKYVVIAFMTNNAKRTVNCFRPFVSPNDMTPFTQPYARISNGEFSIEPNPYQDVSDYQKLLDNEKEELKRLYELDYFTWSNQRPSKNPIVRTIRYVWERQAIGRNVDILLSRPVDLSYGKLNQGDDPYGPSIWHPESLGSQALHKVFDLYHEEVLADGRIPLIVILPSGRDVEGRAKGKSPKHRALLEHFEKEGYRHFDFLDILEKAHGDDLDPQKVFVRTHLNGPSNKLLAEEIIKAFELK